MKIIKLMFMFWDELGRYEFGEVERVLKGFFFYKGVWIFFCGF